MVVLRSGIRVVPFGWIVFLHLFPELIKRKRGVDSPLMMCIHNVYYMTICIDVFEPYVVYIVLIIINVPGNPTRLHLLLFSVGENPQPMGIVPWQSGNLGLHIQIQLWYPDERINTLSHLAKSFPLFIGLIISHNL